MKRIFTFLAFSLLFFTSTSTAQNLYFPPLTGSVWDTVSPASLGWCEDRIEPLFDLLEDENTKAFIVLKDGKIALEKYFGSFEQDSFWYWASAGKTVTSLLVGVAQQEGLLDINDLTSNYLGEGWTACPPEKEALITVRNQLTMSSGLDDATGDPYCTLDTCLIYKADAGTRWAYHNAPYTLLDGVLEAATGQSLNAFYISRLRSKIGMDGSFFPSGYNNVLISTPRSMARFGLLILNKGVWQNTPVLADTAYFNQMVNTSQSINLSYGYLWWLNGKASYMIPQTQFVFPGSLNPAAPDDMISAMGKNGQFVNVVPSQNLVFIRMGNAPDGSLVPFLLNNEIWKKLNEVMCGGASPTSEASQPAVKISPNPANGQVRLEMLENAASPRLQIFDALGNLHETKWENGMISTRHLVPGIYFISLEDEGMQRSVQKLVIER